MWSRFPRRRRGSPPCESKPCRIRVSPVTKSRAPVRCFSFPKSTWLAFRPARHRSSRFASRPAAPTAPRSPAIRRPLRSTAIQRRPVSFVRKRGGGIALLFAEPWSGGPGARLSVRIRHSEKHPYQNLGSFACALHTVSDPDAHPDSVPETVLKASRRRRPASGSRRRKRKSRPITARSRRSWRACAMSSTVATNARDYAILELPSMPVSKSVEPRTMRVLPRGNWMDDSGEIVEPRRAGVHAPDRAAGRQARVAARLRRVARRTGQSAHGADVREPALAAVFRRPGCRARSRISARRASGRRIRSCSTGWRSSFARAAGT